MSLSTALQQFYRTYVTRQERMYLFIFAIFFVVGAAFMLINVAFFHYTGDLYIPTLFLWLSPIILALTLFSLYAEKHATRIAYFTKIYGIYFFIALAMDWLTTGFQFTPFPTIDSSLVQLDQALGFNSVAVLQWTYLHPHILSLFINSYSALGYEMFLIPLIMAFWMEKQAIHKYFLIGLISAFLAGIIYYFFPTAALTSVFHSPYFLLGQHDTFLKFYEVHHRLPVSTYDGGIIAFPSCHVLWALMLIYLCKDKKWLFYPLICLNTLIILSTVMLGWHYLMDVFAAAMVLCISIYLAHALDNHWENITIKKLLPFERKKQLIPTLAMNQVKHRH
jgi:membrane-associated phospholipid phosphatase